MAKIIWTVQPVHDRYQGFVRVNSTVLSKANGAWFSVSEDSFASEMAAQDAAYRLGVKLAAKAPNTLPSDIIIEKA